MHTGALMANFAGLVRFGCDLRSMTVDDLWNEALVCLHRATHSDHASDAALLKDRAAELIKAADLFDHGPRSWMSAETLS